jgi:hypothetical protein
MSTINSMEDVLQVFREDDALRRHDNCPITKRQQEIRDAKQREQAREVDKQAILKGCSS